MIREMVMKAGDHWGQSARPHESSLLFFPFDATALQSVPRSLSGNSVVGCEIEQSFRLAKPVPSDAEGTEAGDE